MRLVLQFDPRKGELKLEAMSLPKRTPWLGRWKVHESILSVRLRQTNPKLDQFDHLEILNDEIAFVDVHGVLEFDCPLQRTQRN